MYKIPVKIEGIERRKRSTGLLHIVAGFFLIAMAGNFQKQSNYENIIAVLPIYIVAVVSLLYGFTRKKVDPVAKYNHWLRMMQFLTFAMTGITMMGFATTMSVISIFLWAAVVLFLMFAERKVFHDTDLIISESGISVPGYFTNHVIPWVIVEDFVLRQDYLTITRANLSYVQLELLNDIDAETINVVNRFSKEQISAHSKEVV